MSFELDVKPILSKHKPATRGIDVYFLINKYYVDRERIMIGKVSPLKSSISDNRTAKELIEFLSGLYFKKHFVEWIELEK